MSRSTGRTMSKQRITVSNWVLSIKFTLYSSKIIQIHHWILSDIFDVDSHIDYDYFDATFNTKNFSNCMATMKIEHKSIYT